MKPICIAVCLCLIFSTTLPGIVRAGSFELAYSAPVFTHNKNRPKTLVADVSKKDVQDVEVEVQDEAPRSLGERMVDFIRKLLGDEKKPVNEELVRDEQ